MAADDTIIIEFGSPPRSSDMDPDDIVVDFLPPPPSYTVAKSHYSSGYSEPSSSYHEEDTRLVKSRQRSIHAISRANSQVDPIMKFMADWPFDDVIKNSACQIYRQMKLSNQHPISKKQALCYCLFRAYKDKGEHADPFLLGLSIGLTPEQTTGCFKYNNISNGSIKSIDGWIDPVELLPQYAMKLNLSDDLIQNMQESFRQLLEKSKRIRDEEGGEDLSEKPVKTIVAAYILNYLQSIGTFPDEASYASIFMLQIPTIKNLAKKITIIENK